MVVNYAISSKVVFRREERLLARRSVPDLDRGVPRRAGDPPAVRAERHATDLICVPFQREQVQMAQPFQATPFPVT